MKSILKSIQITYKSQEERLLVIITYNYCIQENKFKYTSCKIVNNI